MPTEPKTYQNFEEIVNTTNINPVDKKGFKIWPKKKILFIGVGVFILVLLVLVLVASDLKSPLIRPVAQITPTPKSTPTPIAEHIASPSAYATDSAVLEIEAKIRQTDLDLKNVDLKESNLYPPPLDLNIRF